MAEQVTPGHSPESHWRTDGPQPSHELIVNEARAVAEILTQLGPDTPAADVEAHLARCGVRISRDAIERVRLDVRRAAEAARHPGE